MITILSVDCYRGLSASVAAGQRGAQPAFIGRILWPGSAEPEDAFIKLYEASTCGTANEAIGYAVNALRGVAQPIKGAVLLLSKRELPQLGMDWENFVDPGSGIAACWVTSLEQDVKPFRYLRKLSSFSEKQSQAFYMSQFCKLLATVDLVTGNNDRHEGNFLYRDDLHYLAIDQGCVGGGVHWHTMFPDQTASSQLVRLAKENLKASQWAKWVADSIMEYESAQTGWAEILRKIAHALNGLLTPDEIAMITEYMASRASGLGFAKSCEKLI